MADTTIQELIEQAKREGWKKLDLSNRMLTELPESIGQLSALKVLYLNGNQLKALPESIGQLRQLRALYLYGNQLTVLPESIGALEQLQVLYAASNAIASLPASISHLTRLKSLHLGKNQLEQWPVPLNGLCLLRVLNLQENELKEIPVEISGLLRLEKLLLKGNQLSDLPLTLSHLVHLKKLDLDENKLNKIPTVIGQLDNLETLYLDQNQFIEISATVGQLSNLKVLTLKENHLTKVPEVLGQLVNLEELNLSQNHLTKVPEVLGQLVNLKELILSQNQLAEVPEVLGQLVNLKELYLYQNQLTEVPEVLGQLVNLKELYLWGNQLTEVPEVLGQLVNLKELILSQNQLTEVPEVLGQLVNLKVLYLSQNQLTEVPEVLGQLVNLEELNLSQNQLTEVPEVLGQLVNLKELYLYQNQLTEVPEVLGQLVNLEKLYLWGNQLTEVPEVLGQLVNLKELNLSQNQLTEVPEVLGQLVNLEELNLSQNQLTEVPEVLGQLVNLKELYLSQNQLTEVPEVLGQLVNLEKLILSQNQLTEVPEVLGQLVNLKELYLSQNQLTELPKSTRCLSQIETLRLEENSLTVVPDVIVELDKLENLNLDNNPLNPAMQSAYEEGLDGLRSYLQSLTDPEQREELYEAKLVLIGEGGVGKTTLLKALTGKEPKVGQATTHGVEIDIKALSLTCPDSGKTIHLNAWDFGGQEVYRVTHQFFFSQRSVYLLIWEPRRGVQQCQVEDWLKLIRLRVGEKARVIIVSTHCKTGERIARIDHTVLKRDFGDMIVGFCEIDSLVTDPETGEKIGIAQLKNWILQTAQQLDHMGMVLNRAWRESRDALLSIKGPQISYEKFSQTCKDRGLSTLATKALAGLMHDLGYIIYYGDDENLKDDVVLNPEWLTKAIGFVLEDRTTQEMSGILPDNRLKAVWQDHPFRGEDRYPPALYPFFLRLMEKYDVSYRLEDGTASLIAQHVPQVRPPLPWLPEEAPAPDRRRIAMVCVMDEEPTGLVPWMIVRTHDYAYEQRISGNKICRLHWQKGMFLRNKNHGEAMLEMRGREFHVYAEAVWPEYFTNVLQKTLDNLIADTWPGLKDRYFFAVPCQAKNKRQPCSGHFDIGALREFLNDGDETIRCQVCRTRQNILELLYGFEEEDPREQLSRIETNLQDGFAETNQSLQDGFAEINQSLQEFESRVANYFMAMLQAIASESKEGPRLFTIEPVDGNWRRLTKKRYRLHLWCEYEGDIHPVIEDGKGIYEFEADREWLIKAAPYINLVARILKTVTAVATPAANMLIDPQTMTTLDISNQLNIMKEGTANVLAGDFLIPEEMAFQDSVDVLEGQLGKGKEGHLSEEILPTPQTRSNSKGALTTRLKSELSAARAANQAMMGLLSEAERSGILALHSILKKVDPLQENMGLRRVPTYTGNFLWVCEEHYQQMQSKIPNHIQ